MRPHRRLWGAFDPQNVPEYPRALKVAQIARTAPSRGCFGSSLDPRSPPNPDLDVFGPEPSPEPSPASGPSPNGVRDLVRAGAERARSGRPSDAEIGEPGRPSSERRPVTENSDALEQPQMPKTASFRGIWVVLTLLTSPSTAL